MGHSISKDDASAFQMEDFSSTSNGMETETFSFDKSFVIVDGHRCGKLLSFKSLLQIQMF